MLAGYHVLSYFVEHMPEGIAQLSSIIWKALMEWMDAAADMGLLWGRADRFIISRLGNISRDS